MSDLAPGELRQVHLWPALDGGDLPLLRAARTCVLELDIAARLLAGTGGAQRIGRQCARLRTALFCREPERSEAWPIRLVGLDRSEKSRGLLAQRLAVVAEAAHRDPSPAGHTRLLLLAASLMEVSVTRSTPPTDVVRSSSDLGWEKFKADIRPRIRRGASTANPHDRDARTLLWLLLEARNGTAVTHGSYADPSEALHSAINDGRRHAGRLGLSGDFAEFLDRLVGAARAICPVPRVLAGIPTLLDQHRDLVVALEAAINHQQRS
jgi:hypothetical protein